MRAGFQSGGGVAWRDVTAIGSAEGGWGGAMIAFALSFFIGEMLGQSERSGRRRVVRCGRFVCNDYRSYFSYF